MKKSILLATTALISAFALNARADSATAPTAQLTVKVMTVRKAPSISEQRELNFGAALSKQEQSGKVVITPTGDYSSSTATIAALPEPGIIRLSDWSGSLMSSSTHRIPSISFGSVTLEQSGGATGECGTITNFEVGNLSQVPGGDGKEYNIPFGATWNVPDGNSGVDFVECEGKVTATLILVDKQ